jgi:putative transposase
VPIGLSPLDKEVIDLEKARTCAFQANYHLIWATKYRRKVLVGSVRVRLEDVLKTIAEQNGCRLLAARVHDGDHVHVFVSAPHRVAIPEMVRVLKCISAKVLFEEFAEIKVQLWGGHLWSEGYAVRTAGDVTGPKIEEYINRK